MDTTAELSMYQEALRAEGTAILRWDLNADRVYGDYSLRGMIPEKLKNEKYSAFLLQSLPLHPNDRVYFISLVEFLKKPHPEFADSTYEKVLEYRVKEDSGEYRWYHARYIVHFEKEWAQYAVILLRNTDSEHRRNEELQQKAERDALTGLYNKGYAREVIKEALAGPENGEERNCYKVVTDSNRPCVRCKHFKLRGKCPVGLRLKRDAEHHNLAPFSVLWEGDGNSNVFVDNVYTI